MPFTWSNLSFETAGADPMNPSGWTVAFVSSDQEIAEYDPNNTISDPHEDYEEGWADFTGAQASVLCARFETYTIGAGATLDVEVDGGAPQTVTFVGTETTAAAVAAQISTDVTGATAVAVTETNGIRVRLSSDTLGAASSIEVTGGTAQVSLEFPLVLVQVQNNENALFAFAPADVEAFEVNTTPNEGGEEAFEREHGPYDGTGAPGYRSKVLTLAGFQGNEFFTTTPGTTAAQYDVGISEGKEDFEEEWDFNEGAIQLFGTQSFRIETFVAGTYTIQLFSRKDGGIGITETFTSSGAGTAAAVIGALDTQINALSVLASSIDTSPQLDIIPLLSPTDIAISIVAIPSGAIALVIVDNDPSSLDDALFDAGTPEDREDFEEEWNNDTYTRCLVWNTAFILTAETGTYTVTWDGNAAVEVADVGSDTEISIATALAATLSGISGVDIVNVLVGPPVSIEIEPDDRTTAHTLTATHSVTPGNVAVGAASTSPAVFGVASYDGGAPEDVEDFEEITTVHTEVLINNVVSGRSYAIDLNGTLHTYVAQGGDTPVIVAQELADAIDNGSTPNSGSRVIDRSLITQDTPGVELLVDLIATTASDMEITTAFLVRPTELWTGASFADTLLP